MAKEESLAKQFLLALTGLAIGLAFLAACAFGGYYYGDRVGRREVMAELGESKDASEPASGLDQILDRAESFVQPLLSRQGTQSSPISSFITLPSGSVKKLMSFDASVEDGVKEIAVSPDSQRIALLAGNGHLRIADLSGRITDCGFPGIKRHEGKVHRYIRSDQLTFSPNGSKLGYVDQINGRSVASEIFVCDSKTGKLLNSWERDRYTKFYWLSDSSILVNNPFEQLDVGSSKPSKQNHLLRWGLDVSGRPVSGWGIAGISADRSLIAISRDELIIVKVESGKEVGRFDKPYEDDFIGFDVANRPMLSTWKAGIQDYYTVDVLHGGNRQTVNSMPLAYRTARTGGQGDHAFYISPSHSLMRFSSSSSSKTTTTATTREEIQSLHLYAKGKPVWSHDLRYITKGPGTAHLVAGAVAAKAGVPGADGYVMGIVGSVPSSFYADEFCWFPDGCHFVYAGHLGSPHDLWIGECPSGMK